MRCLLCSPVFIHRPNDSIKTNYKPDAAQANRPLSKVTTTHTRLTISGVASISLVRFQLRAPSSLGLTEHLGKKKKKQGFTPRLLPASEDFTLPGAYNLGLVRQIHLGGYIHGRALSVLLLRVPVVHTRTHTHTAPRFFFAYYM